MQPLVCLEDLQNNTNYNVPCDENGLNYKIISWAL